MKYRYILILIITILTISCDSIDSHINSNFEIFELDTNQISLDSFGNSIDLNISSNNNWEINSIPNWIQISEIKGSGNATLSIGADEHRSIEERRIDITFSHLSGVDTLSIKQNGIEEYLFSVDSQIKRFTNEGNEVELSIETDGSWNIISDCDWIEISPSEGEGNSIVKIKASINEQALFRVDYCLINSNITGVEPLKIELFQDSEIDRNQISLDRLGTPVELTINSNINWSMNSISDWIHISEVEDNGSSTLLISADENLSIEERSSNIVLTHTLGENSINITQDGISEYIFNVDSKIKNFTIEGNEVELSIETDGLWNITSDCDWIEITPSEGEGSSIVKMKASINDQTVSRVDYCLVNSNIIGIEPLKIELIQDGPMGSFAKDSLALVALYSELRDGTLPWDISSPVSTWEGVTLNLRDGENRVTKIKIDTESLEEYSGIERTLFIPELFNLKYIESFDIEGLSYDMIGDIPSDILEWQKLKYLRLVNTNIREQYTASIKNLKNLENLIIYDTFTATPYYQIITEEFSELNKLEYLYLRTTISGEVFPEVIFELENLKSLNLQFYRDIEITTIPDRFNELPNLESLTITFNEPPTLTSLPLSINSCSKLINYSSNFLVKNVSLDDYSFLKNIEFLNFSNIDLSSYTLDEVIPYLSNYIEELNLSGCSITGSVSDEIISLKYIKSLDITSNSLSGTVSEDFLEKANNLYWHINPQQNGVSLDLYTINKPIYSEFIDERDDNIYKTVIIGEQEWMAENLNYLPTDDYFYYVHDYQSWRLLVAKDKAYGYIDNDDDGLEYGCLYTREAAQVVCPEGWHLSSRSEWSALKTTLASNGHSFDGNLNGYYLNKAITSTEGWSISNVPSSPGNNSELNNSSGLNMKPTGYMCGFMSDFGNRALFWFSDTSSNIDKGINIVISSYFAYDYFYAHYQKMDMMPVRCIKD